MPNISESVNWIDEIYQISRMDKVEGGAMGVANMQARQLAARTRFLKLMLEGQTDYNEFTFFKTDDDPDGTIKGLEKTPAGKLFRVPQGMGSDTSFIYYLNDNGVAVAMTDTAGAELIRKMSKLVDSSPSDNEILSVSDKYGFLAFEILFNAIHHPQMSMLFNSDDDDFSVVDKYGFVAFSAKWMSEKILQLEKALYENDDNSGQGPENIISSLDAAALGYSQNVNNTLVTGIQRAVFDYNIVVTSGQSLSTANEGYPALSKIALEVQNVLMFGQSVRGLDRLAPNWRPVGGPSLTGLRAVVQQRDTVDSVLMTDEQVAALPAGSQHEGESFDVGAVNFWRMLQNDFRGVTVNHDRKIVVLNCGVAGRTIEQLSKGANPELFSRIRIALRQLKAHIQSISPDASMGVVAMMHAQGEYNYNGTDGGTRNEDEFLALTTKFRSDANDVFFDEFGQTSPPAFFTYQTSGSWVVDSTKMAIGNAQIRMGDTVPGVWVSAPSYPVTDKGGHLDPNGYRWLGMQFGKVLHRIIDRGINWKPVKPLSAVYAGNSIYNNFHAPCYPIIFKECYDANTAKLYPNKGFRVTTKELVELPIISVEIVGVATTKITLAVDVPEGAIVWYGSKTGSNGNGNLCDSDSTVAPYNYEYHPGTGQYASANIPALVNKPYPLNNFCTNFAMTAKKIEG
ncbi:hypothetical protein ACJ0NE_15135 [Klebsiella oxytoca]|uniref:hypothetical protein n=1 Tax=Klebsiella oxytoca TaxID=571 RepID=UPI00388B6715